MNYAWCFMVLLSLVCAFVNGRIPETVEAMLSGAGESIFTLLSFAGIMCFWTGILKIGEDSGVLKLAEKLFSPLIKRLFPNSSQQARTFIAINLSANLLGMGNAATPIGIKAMEKLDSENNISNKPSRSMAMFAVFNTASITIFPTTVIALRTAAGSSAPYDIIVPIWVASLTALTTGIILVKIFFGNNICENNINT